MVSTMCTSCALAPVASDTDVIVKAYAWSTAFSHGGASQDYALADGRRLLPALTFPPRSRGSQYRQTPWNRTKNFDLEFWIRNDSEIASHNNNFELVLPAGWALVAGGQCN